MKIRYAVLLCLFIILGGCKSKNTLYDISKQVIEAKSYSAIADITIIGNKGVSKYKVKQYYVGPDKMRLETLEPSFMQGKIVVLFNNKWWIKHPLFASSFEISRPKDEDALILLGVIEKNVFINQTSKLYSALYKNMKCVCIKSLIPNGNKFRNSTVLYINEKTRLPVGMTIMDEKDNENMEILYSDFKMNEEYKSSLFILK